MFFQIVTFGCGAEGRGYLVLWFKNESVISFYVPFSEKDIFQYKWNNMLKKNCFVHAES
jgi:hypothetical protein